MMLFSSFDSGQWPTSVSSSPAATAAFGQPSYTGTGGNGGTGGYTPAPSASTFNHPTAAMYSTSGSELYVADTLNNRVVTLPFGAGAFSAATQVLGQLTFTLSAPSEVSTCSPRRCVTRSLRTSGASIVSSP